MGDASIKGGRSGGRAGWSGTKRPHRNYNEHWLEHEVHDLYQRVVDEPVPKDMLDIVTRIPKSNPSPDAERAWRWRAKAEEVRTAADSMRSDSARHTLLELARDYDVLAESLELALRQQPSGGRDAG